MVTETLKPCILTPRQHYLGKPTPAGDKYYTGVKLSIDPDTGVKVAEPGDRINLDAYIQASAASTDIVSIIQRLQQGDTSVINVRQDGIEGDITQLPKNINDVMAIGGLSDKAREGFNNLPEGIKALFDNDPSVFFDAVLQNKVDAIIAQYKPPVEESKKEEGGAE